MMANSSPEPAGAARRSQRSRFLAAVGAIVLAVAAPSLVVGAVPAVASVDGAGAALAAAYPAPPGESGMPGLGGTDLDDLDVDAASVGVETEDDAEEAGLDVQQAAIRLTGEARGRLAPAALARQVEGVSLVTALVLGTVTLDLGEAGDRELEVAAVNPAFRRFTPHVTAEADQVWERIADGDAAFVHEVGQELAQEHGIALGERVGLAGEEGPDDDRSAPTLRIGAYASNGAPPVAEAVVSRRTAAALGLTGETVVLVAVDDGADLEEVAEQLEERTGLVAEVLAGPSVRRAFLSRGESREAFEPFRFVSLGDGMIQIDGDWVQRNIVTERVPIFRGAVTCHRLMMPQLRGALQEIEDRGLAHLIDPSQYGGCWVPRHILFNPRRALSMHAWGLAIDFNVSTNQYGAEPQLDHRIVEIFEHWGFAWGGHWSTPDGMHFELAVLLDTGER